MHARKAAFKGGRSHEHMTAKAAAERAAVIRKQNVKRHENAAAQTKLREELQRHTANRNKQMELARLHAASLRYSGLDALGLARLNKLQANTR